MRETGVALIEKYNSHPTKPLLKKTVDRNNHSRDKGKTNGWSEAKIGWKTPKQNSVGIY